MKLYLVRHGESEGNIAKRHQGETEKLTPLGEKQAKVVAQRFSHTKVNRIIASPMKRARQTAEAIAKVTGSDITFDDQFKEIKNPSEVIDKPHSDKKAKEIYKTRLKNSHDPDFHYSDEENHFDFLRRISTGLASLEFYHEDDCVVLVCHGHVIRALFGLIIFGPEFSVREFELLIDRISTNNTGVTVCEFDPTTRWTMVTYNDHAHLLE